MHQPCVSGPNFDSRHKHTHTNTLQHTEQSRGGAASPATVKRASPPASSPSTTAAAATAVATPPAATPPPAAAKKKVQQQQQQKAAKPPSGPTPVPKSATREAVGHRVRVWWSADAEWYSGEVASYDTTTGEHLVEYDDGDIQTIDLQFDKVCWHATALFARSLTHSLCKHVFGARWSTWTRHHRAATVLVASGHGEAVAAVLVAVLAAAHLTASELVGPVAEGSSVSGRLCWTLTMRSWSLLTTPPRTLVPTTLTCT